MRELSSGASDYLRKESTAAQVIASVPTVLRPRADLKRSSRRRARCAVTWKAPGSFRSCAVCAGPAGRAHHPARRLEPLRVRAARRAPRPAHAHRQRQFRARRTCLAPAARCSDRPFLGDHGPGHPQVGLRRLARRGHGARGTGARRAAGRAFGAAAQPNRTRRVRRGRLLRARGPVTAGPALRGGAPTRRGGSAQAREAGGGSVADPRGHPARHGRRGAIRGVVGTAGEDMFAEARAQRARELPLAPGLVQRIISELPSPAISVLKRRYRRGASRTGGAARGAGGHPAGRPRRRSRRRSARMPVPR